MSTAKFVLEHFYFGQIVHEGKARGEPRLLAASPGISPGLAEHAVQRVTLPPLIRSGNGAWALVRGRHRQVPFLLVQAQIGQAGQMVAHYVVATPDVLKALGGNLQVLLTLVEDELPKFEQVGNLLPVLEIPNAGQLPVDEQIDDILELMTVTRNNTQIIEPLLAAIVQGVQLIVQGAPADLRQRVQFIEGLLALLPPSARFGVTFTTHSLPSTDIDAQIRFYSDDLPPADTIVFNWPEGRVSGTELSDDYSRFVMSQLRLDAELVIQRNMGMTSIAGWRLNNGDKLAEALGYASSRLRVDEALRNNQPVSKDEVSRILADDPTLSGDLRILYAQHLVKFSLAMQDMQHAEPVAALLNANVDLENAVLQLLTEALDNGDAYLVYPTLVEWMRLPTGPQGLGWVDLTHRSALVYLSELVEDLDLEGINQMLRDLQQADGSIDISYILAEVLNLTRPLYPQDAEMVENLFLLAVKFLDRNDFRRLMNTIRFRDQLAPQIRRLWAMLNASEDEAASPQMMVQVARGFGPAWESLVLLRFAEVACETKHFEAFDLPALDILVQIAKSEVGKQRREMLLGIAGALDDAILGSLDMLGPLRNMAHPGPARVLQIRLALGDYARLAQSMIRQAAELYTGDRQTDYLIAIDTVFSEISLPVEEVTRVLQTINYEGIKSVPFIVAAVSLIKDHSEPELDGIAAQVTVQLSEAADYLMDVIPPNVLLNLTKFYARRQDLDGIDRIAHIVPRAALYLGNNGVRLMVELVQVINWDDEAVRTAMNMMRQFVRLQSDDDMARKVVGYFGRELGRDMRRPLEVTYLFRRLLSGKSLANYASDIAVVNGALHDAVTIYASGKYVPTVGDLFNALGSLPGGLDKLDRHNIAQNLMATGRAIVHLGQQYRSKRGRDEKAHIQQLLRRETDPKSGIDVLWMMSGYLGQARPLPLALKEVSYPLEGRTTRNLVDEFEATAQVMGGLVNAFPPNRDVNLTWVEVQHELESLRDTLPDKSRLEIQRQLAQDLQQLVQLLATLEQNGDAKAFEDSALARKIESGKYRPRSALEYLRFIQSFFAARS